MNKALIGFQNWWFECRPVWRETLLRLLGAVLLIDALGMVGLYQHYYTEDGILSAAGRRAMMAVNDDWNLFSLLPFESAIFSWSVLGLYIVALGFMIRGRRLRLWCGLTFLCSSYFYARFPYIDNGGFGVARILLFCAVFAPLSKPSVWSGVVGWGSRFVQLQISYIYLTNAVCKISGSTWLNGTALYYIGRSTDFHRLNFSWIFDNVPLLLISTQILPVLYILVSLGLWWRWTRLPCLIFVFGLHLMIDLTMVVPVFGPAMILGALFFVTEKDLELWRSWARRVAPARFRTA